MSCVGSTPADDVLNCESITPEYVDQNNRELYQIQKIVSRSLLSVDQNNRELYQIQRELNPLLAGFNIESSSLNH